MKLPPPAVRDTSCILISKKRLIAILGHLGFLGDSPDGLYLLSMIHSLWQEAHEYASENAGVGVVEDSKYHVVGKPDDGNDTTSSQNDDDEETNEARDLIELGTLKWILFGFPARQPSWWSQFCMPCGLTVAEKALQKSQNQKAQDEHPVKVSGMKRRHGELVRHDVLTCKLCITATGCQAVREEDQKQKAKDDSASAADSEEAAFAQAILPRQYNPSLSMDITAPASLLAPADDDSYVDTSSDSAVEISTISSLLHGEILLEKAEEKVRL